MSEVWKDESTGRLYLFGGKHRPFDYALGKVMPRESSFSTFSKNIEKRRAFCADHQIRYEHFVFPDKHTVEVQQYEGQKLKPIIQMYATACRNTFFSPLECLKAAETPTYHKTDTHWNANGQALSALYVADKLGITKTERRAAQVEFDKGRRDKAGYVGDLGEKLSPREMETTVTYQKPSHIYFINNELEGNTNEGFIRIFINMAAPDRRLLISGDSFAMSFLFHLSHFFRFIVFLRSRYMHYEIVEQIKPTHIFTSNVERYFSDVDDDDNRPYLFLIQELRNKKNGMSRAFAELFNGLLSFGRPRYFAALAKIAHITGFEKMSTEYFSEGLRLFPKNPYIRLAMTEIERPEVEEE